jgi:uncharacterized protein
MTRTFISAVSLLAALAVGTPAFASTDSANCSPGSTSDETKCVSDVNPEGQFSPAPLAVAKPGGLLAATIAPKVVFQINHAADAQTVLRFVANYLIAEPAAEVAVVGYAGGVDFMLKGAKDSAGKPYAGRLQALADKGVHFKACGNTLKSRKLSAAVLVDQAVVVQSAVNEIIRLQTREGYAYFRH